MSSVWAPGSHRVELLLPTQGRATFDGARRVAMHQDGEWWHGPDLAPGTDYGFSLDDGPGRPDPGSPYQPYGVHGPSQTFDPSFEWTDAAWPGRDVRESIIYELHIGTFTPEGTLDAAIERLDHLVDLGITMVELMPLAAFAGRWGWGYDGVHLYAVHEPYGGPRALQRFVAAAHEAGLAVALDVVYNHLGPAGNYLSEFGPYFTDAHTTPWGWAVNLDRAGSGEVREWIIKNALRWFDEFHIDALRLDAVHELVDDSPAHLLAKLSDRVAALSTHLGRPLGLIAESDRNDPTTVTPTADGGLGMDAQWADDVHHALHALITGERHGYYVDFGSLDTLRHVLSEVFVHDGGFSTFRGKNWGHPVPGAMDRRQFIAFAQDHDQIGNRALGDRMSARTDSGGLAIAAALTLLSPFTPMLFMGEEWSAGTPWMYFTDHEEELGRAVSEGRRQEFSGHGWTELYGGDVEVPDPQDPATFTASHLNWSEPSRRDHRRMLEWYRTLIRLRATFSPRWPARLFFGHDGSFVVNRDTFVVTRGLFSTVVNLTEEPRAVDVGISHPSRIVAAWDRGARLEVAPADGHWRNSGELLHLPPRSVAVLGANR